MRSRYTAQMRALALVALVGCGGTTDAPVELRFVADPGAAGSERYLCFGFDASPLAGADLGGIAFAAGGGPVSLHHISLFASTETVPDGPVDCVTMPETAIPLNVWATGGGDLALPSELALAVPAGTTRLIVQAHALRTGDGTAATSSVTLAPRTGAPIRAGWLPLRAPVPAIAPHTEARTQYPCAIAGELHVISTWPHMHRIGTEFHGAPLIDVVPYDFEAQRAYPIDVRLAPGDSIMTECVWFNTTDTTVLPGPEIDDEMCGQSLIAWPVEAAHCS